MKKLNAGLLSLLTLAMLVGCGGNSETEPKTDDPKTGNMISISAKNSFEGEVKIINGLPQTTKNDSTHHGFGLKSIKMICEKYHGTMNFQTLDNCFNINLLFLEQEK